MVEAEALTIPEDILMATITEEEEEEALAEPPSTLGGSNEVNGDKFRFEAMDGISIDACNLIAFSTEPFLPGA